MCWKHIVFIFVVSLFFFIRQKKTLEEDVFAAENGDYLIHIKNLERKFSGPPMVTFTNNAQKDFVKSFICNLLSINESALVPRLVVIVSERETFNDLKHFNSDVSVLLKPFQAHSKDLKYGTDSYEDYIEYRYYKNSNRMVIETEFQDKYSDRHSRFWIINYPDRQ